MRKIREGFWHSQFEPELPMPKESEPWEGEADFLRRLAQVENKILAKRYRGFSLCRICGCANGCREFMTDKAVWPSGFRHYVEIHNIKPSEQFREYIEDLIKEPER